MQKNNVVAIVQARMGSTRLPRKVLLDIAGKPMLAWVVERTQRAQRIDQVCVATTQETSDDAVVVLCKEHGYQYYRGELYDVLDRYYQAARKLDASVIVRITADCPLIDPALIDLTIEEFFINQVDFAANRLPQPWGRTYPIGLDVEVCSFYALKTAWRNADQPHQREHVMPYIYETARVEDASTISPSGNLVWQVPQPRSFKILLLNNDTDYGSLRWTVDTSTDLGFVREIFNRLQGRDDFTWRDVLALIKNEPELSLINADVIHKTHKEVDGRIAEVS